MNKYAAALSLIILGYLLGSCVITCTPEPPERPTKKTTTAPDKPVRLIAVSFFD